MKEDFNIVQYDEMNEEGPAELEIVNLDKLLSNRRLSPKAPWKIARQLEDQKAAEFITMQEVYDKLSTFNDIRDKALFTIAYLCAVRCEELVRNTPIIYGKKKVFLVKNGKGSKKFITDYTKKRCLPIKQSMKKEDILYENFNGKKVMIFRVRNLKNKNKGQNVKLIPLTLDDELHIKFKKIIDTFIAGFENEEELFPICKRRAEQIISKAGFNTHFLRKLRLTHLVRYYNFSDEKLKVFAGWSDSRPSKFYIRVGLKDLVNSMERRTLI
jgi:integrase